MGFQTYSSFMSHVLGDKCQTSLLSAGDASSEGDLSVCGERGDSPAPLSHQGSLESDSCAADSSNGHLSPTLDSHKNTRQRTAQACDKCRERKTKCSGNRPMCNRCSTRGLICEYSVRESRVRTPIRVRAQPPMSSPNPLQVNYHDIIRPTPAYHSRMGQGQSQAFAPASYPRTVSHSPAPSSSGLSSEKGARMNFSHEQPIPLGLGLGLLPGGRLTAAPSKRGLSTWNMRVDALRPQSAPITPQSATDPGVPSRRFKMEPNDPQVQDTEEGSSVSYGYEYAGRRCQTMAVPSVRVQENSPYRRSPLGGSTEVAEGSSQWYKNIDNTSLAVPRSSHDGRPSSMPTMPLVQHNTPHSQKEFESYYDTSMYRPNLFEDWTGPSSVGPDVLPEATSILAAHYNSLERMSSDDASFSNHERIAGSNIPGAPSSLQDVDPLEVLCPAPLPPIGSGIFGLPSSVPLPHCTAGKPPASYDAAHLDAVRLHQHQQNTDFDSMYMHFSHGADIGGGSLNIHHQNPNILRPHPHAGGRQPQPQHPGDVAFMSITGHPGDFNEYDFF